MNKDQLEGVTCTKTNQEVNAWQQMTLEKLPIVLILHLKWFDYKGDVCTKILKTVDFPIELKLDPSKCLTYLSSCQVNGLMNFCHFSLFCLPRNFVIKEIQCKTETISSFCCCIP